MKLFNITRLKLTSWYLIIITIISITFSFAIYRIQIVELSRFVSAQVNRLESRFGRGQGKLIIDPDQLISEAQNRIITRLVLLNGIVLIVSGGLGYFLAGKTLSPIKQTIIKQRRFVSDAAHELRTPLAAMRVSSEVFLRDKTPKISEAVELIKDNIKDIVRLQSLTDSLLNLSELEYNDIKINFKVVELSKIAKSTIKNTMPFAKKKGIKLSLKTTPIYIKGDDARLVELFTILLDNAIKYTNQKGYVELQISKQGNYAQIIVEDNGIGIDEQDLTHIFDRFYRSDQARERSLINGYGLGLSIAKNIIDSHKGSIRVISTLKKGTQFTIRIPLSSA